jgi:hypothetical protein
VTLVIVMQTAAEYIEERTTTIPNGIGCQLWTGAYFSNGYGRISRGGYGAVAAHRLAFEVYKGRIPPGLCVLHKCDTPACCNPDHLFLGTQKDNSVDMANKGRGANQKKTHCPSGHEYTKENTYIGSTGSRLCKACHQEYNKKAIRLKNQRVRYSIQRGH